MPQIPKTELHWTEGHRYFTIESRIEGESLNNALPRLTQQDLAHIGQQSGQYLLHLKTILFHIQQGSTDDGSTTSVYVPFTFGHSELHEGNVMMKDGSFAGRIG
ncbi:hypothetical protein F5Y00DRAFT_258990 [Daldinia vernicosa]|uniref:uncharacterized protein n=1 Tax=Daldinia vernicosa TaxID=114800 RepID=UPI002008C9A9|nr:uncharacterized protein F5Y00DRAFT_258990 [Daldinia vernicosa]KAI0852033.1 hypothetical protein F5Y00DRAFT_258990 [Daldinia vernicosa]